MPAIVTAHTRGIGVYSTYNIYSIHSSISKHSPEGKLHLSTIQQANLIAQHPDQQNHLQNYLMTTKYVLCRHNFKVCITIHYVNMLVGTSVM